MICLPSVSRLEGTPLLVPDKDHDLIDLLGTLGGNIVTGGIKGEDKSKNGGRINSDEIVACPDEATMETLMVTSSMMGPLYGMLRTNRDFLISNDVPSSIASSFVIRTYHAMILDALGKNGVEDGGDDNDDDGRGVIDRLIEEQTPGGLNENALRTVKDRGGYEAMVNAMEETLLRIRGGRSGD